MKRLMISAIAAIAMLAAATNMLRSHSPSAGRPVGMMSQDLRTATDVNQLPVEEYDDQSLVYSKLRR
ncbi:MAG: hypothetical protein Q7U92_21800 [Bradyrhizobium sp.]|nr:hypothetical protein [Bradyrhizobium sp.]